MQQSPKLDYFIAGFREAKEGLFWGRFQLDDKYGCNCEFGYHDILIVIFIVVFYGQIAAKIRLFGSLLIDAVRWS